MEDKYQEVLDRFHCEHPQIEIEIRYKTDSIGRRFYKKQCLICGNAISGAISLENVSNIDRIKEWDYSLYKDYHTNLNKIFYEIQLAQENERQDKQNRWWEWYNNYLNSPEWREKRERVLERDNYRCRACEDEQATEVHHLTYNHVGSEPLFELVSVCNFCHEMITKLDRKRKENGS